MRVAYAAASMGGSVSSGRKEHGPGNAPRMTVASNSRPRVAVDGDRLRLSGSWTLDHAAATAEALRSAPQATSPIDATGVDRPNSPAGVQLLRRARGTGS